MASWRQGDCVLGEHWFALRIDPALPLSSAAQVAAAEGADLAEEQVRGLVVVTQTCDIVRSCVERPFIEVCPLVEVDELRLQEVDRGRRPGYAVVPELVHERLVADLDRTMTVEKPVVAQWRRTPGCNSDAERRVFAQALARKRARFAFPDDFVALMRKLQGRLAGKHDKSTAEGRGLRALREIRVQAAPDWGADAVTLWFWFIRGGDDGDPDRSEAWAELLAAWLALIELAGRFTAVDGQVASLADLTAEDYVHSDRLDLDHLSASRSAR